MRLSIELDERIEVLVRSGFPLVGLISREEGRVLSILDRVAESTKRSVVEWDRAAGAVERRPASPSFDVSKVKNALDMLDAIERHAGPALFVLKDFRPLLTKDDQRNDDASVWVTRRLRNLCGALKAQTHSKTIFLVQSGPTLPDELRDDVHVVDVPLPTREELRKVFDTTTARLAERVKLGEPGIEKVVESGLGLTTSQFTRALARVVMTHDTFDERAVDLLLDEKKQIIRETGGALEFFPPTETLESIGGLGELKGWLRRREIGLCQEARRYKIPLPKGILLIGIPGTGKSLTAKVIANLWKLPLLRMDMGAIFGSLVGQSEASLRTVITVARDAASEHSPPGL